MGKGCVIYIEGKILIDQAREAVVSDDTLRRVFGVDFILMRHKLFVQMFKK